MLERYFGNLFQNTAEHRGGEQEHRGTVLCVHEQAKRIIEMSSGCSNASEFQQLSEFDKEEYLNEFKNKGLSIRQVSMLTGVSFGLVRKFY